MLADAGDRVVRARAARWKRRWNDSGTCDELRDFGQRIAGDREPQPERASPMLPRRALVDEAVVDAARVRVCCICSSSAYAREIDAPVGARARLGEPARGLAIQREAAPDRPARTSRPASARIRTARRRDGSARSPRSLRRARTAALPTSTARSALPATSAANAALPPPSSST